MEPLILTVDMAGLPQAWVELEEAITYHAKQMVAWSIGREVREFRGGWQRNGVRSRIATRSILAIKGSAPGRHRHAPGLTNQMLFVRDRQVWERVHAFHLKETPPAISHLLYAYHEEP